MALIFKYINKEGFLYYFYFLDKYTEFIHHAYYECRKWKGESHRKT